MIIVLFSRPDYEYDVHSLIKAFFPKEEVQMYYTCSEEEAAEQKAACTRHAQDEESTARLAEAGHVFYVTYDNAAGRIFLSCERKQPGQKPEEPAEIRKTDDFPVDFSDRTAAKNELKRHLYGMLRELCGQELPWGSLTGIRPTKIPMKMLEEGQTREQIASYMRENYLVSEEKIRLSIEIAERETKLLQQIDYADGYSLYIGIPFCPSTCLYCSFTSYPLKAWAGKVDSYLDALEKEIDDTAQMFCDKKLNSIYIGGGTPTTLGPSQLDRLIRKIKCSFDLSDCREFTVEAGRPDSVTREKLLVLKKHGISRISINPQTMKQETLDLIGRRHTVEQTKESFYLARELGFDNINMDLIIGLPQENIDDVRHTMEMLQELRPDNVTVHSLAMKRASRLTLMKEQYGNMAMVNTQEHMQLCEEYCRAMGLFPYYLYRQKGMTGNLENVGYAAEGKAGLYNILIMEEVQTIVALGAGSISKRVYPDGTIKRCENVKDAAQYIARIDEMIGRKRVLFSD